MNLHPVFGACLEIDGRDLVLLARTRRGYSALSRLLSIAHRDQPKGEARTTLSRAFFDDLEAKFVP